MLKKALPSSCTFYVVTSDYIAATFQHLQALLCLHFEILLLNVISDFINWSFWINCNSWIYSKVWSR